MAYVLLLFYFTSPVSCHRGSGREALPQLLLLLL